MFYSHEILTSRKHGVATIWLMATLGTKSGHKKITKKAILDVNLPKACETVTEPDKPLALRLQGSLLVGISRVFGQQCEYMAQDTENLRTKMKKVVRETEARQIDPSLATNRPEQLNLPEDPAFNIDLDIGLDFSIFDFSTDTSRKTKSSSSRSQGTSQSSLQIADQEQGMRLSSPPFDRDRTDFLDTNFTSFRPMALGSNDSNNDIGLGLYMNEQAIYDNADMHVDDDGQLIFASDPGNLPVLSSDHLNQPEAVDPTMVMYQSQPEHTTHQNLGFEGDNDRPTIFDDYPMLPPEQAGLAMHKNDTPLIDPDEEVPVPTPDAEVTTGAKASQRIAQRNKPARTDRFVELSNGQIEEWEQDYLGSMARSHHTKLLWQSAAQARRNAAFWVLDQGIGGVKVNFGTDVVPHPFSIFSGRVLLNVFQEVQLPRKRSRSISNSSDDNDKRSRVRSLAPGTVRHDTSAVSFDHDEGILPLQDDLQPESEVGRQAEASLKDHSSQMPWNISSRQGSARIYGSALHRASSMTGSAGGLDIGPPSNVLRRQTRLTSASPLFGKGIPLSRDQSFEAISQSRLTYDIDDFDDLDQNLAGDLRGDFELYGPAAAVSTQQAAESQWIATTLEQEGQNFFDFLGTSIHSLAGQTPETRNTITFASLLPPKQNSQIVAAQAFLHVLSLATKGLIEIEQEEGFGDITLMMSDHATGILPKNQDL